jgi:hypothetical protein
VKLYEICNNQKKKIIKGELKVLRLKKEKIFLLLVGEYSYSLSKDLQTMRSSINQYVLPNIDGFLGVLIPDNADYEVLDKLETLLRETTDFLISKHSRTAADIQRSATFDLEAADHMQNQSKARKFSQLLETGGEHIKNSLIRAATFTSSHIRRGSEFLKSKIKSKGSTDSLSSDSGDEEKKEDRKKEITMKGLKIVSSAALVLSKAVVVGAVATSKEIGKWVAQHFEQSQTSRELEKNQAYQQAKVVSSSGIKAAASVFDGLEEALVILGRSGAEAAVDVAEHKYGSKGKKRAGKAVEVISDVGLICREVNKIGVRTAVEAAKELSKEENSKK